MKNLVLLAITIVLTLTGCTNKARTIEWISSNPDSTWRINQVETIFENNTADSCVNIYTERVQQEVDGFGGCFNELGWEALNQLTRNEKEKILKELFDTIDGCKFNICRMPIGANDYAIDWYSLNDTKDDFSMEHFSIERDQQRLIPYIKQAKTYNPKLKIWASPWCPPAWMKTNNHYACKPDTVNDLQEEGRGKEMQTQFKMKEKYLAAYALYFSKFIQAYKNEDIDVYAVHVQNEPNSCQNFPSCVWEPSDLATFIGKYLGPQFNESKLNTEIWLGTIERPQIERVGIILTHPEARKYIKGVGFQWAGKYAIPEVHKKYSNYRLMQTETECGDGSNDWNAAEYTFELMKHYFKNGTNSYMYWNMVLNETGKSQWGWKQNSMITINSKTKEVTYNPEFYLMKHFSYFIKSGARKLETSDENCIAFKNPDSIIVVYYNSGKEKEIAFAVNKLQFNVMLSGKSFNTFKIMTRHI